ncbi:hypothetical protein NE237_029087 [Protea cynaroides]|uniref:Uncharacterized protein n=1 Tax=Protea cynaroides TaxID=273540 RepID=A0A9Q0GTN8_9MAGN|nr:hypothetical protein NE237_029087 [Protea cynaroides]
MRTFANEPNKRNPLFVKKLKYVDSRLCAASIDDNSKAFRSQFAEFLGQMHSTSDREEVEEKGNHPQSCSENPPFYHAIVTKRSAMISDLNMQMKRRNAFEGEAEYNGEE